MLAVYTYSDASGIQRNAESDEFNFVGTWSSTGTYTSNTFDTVNYSNGQFTCIVDNLGYNPTAQPAKWSPLILRIPATPSNTILGYIQETINKTSRYVAANYANGQLISVDPYENILTFSRTSGDYLSLLNSAGTIIHAGENWAEIIGHNCINLNSVDFHGNVLTTLDLTGATALTWLECQQNLLSSLDVSTAPALSTLWCFNNQLTSLILPSNAALTTLRASTNQLTTLDISNTPALTSLECASNQLTALDISNNPLITNLDCSDNQLSTIDISNISELRSLHCNSNLLTVLDMSNNPVLNDMAFSDNKLVTITLLNNTNLESLECSNNLLTTLDISNNPLNYLDGSNNALTQSAIDSILLSLVTNGLVGFVDLSGGTNAPPSTPTGQGYVTTLKNGGWTVTTN